ncbi:MAG: aminotransferase class V-fold PLP-dependent enzyme [Candidatus Promineifilaceae bacterium]
MTFDIERAREETLGCDEIVHFNNAGSSLMPIPVSDFLHAYLYQEERIGGYETAAAQARMLENFYTATAKLLNCNSAEIAFIENATRAWDMAFYSFQFQPGDKILTTISEYGSNVIAYLQAAKRTGAEVVFVPDDEHGQIDVDALESMIDERVKLIAISHIPTGGGLVNPAAAVGKIANAAGVPYLLDACQSVGQLEVDVQAIGCDMLSGTGRKYLRGPRGTGLLYVRQSLIEQLDPPFLDQYAADLVSPTEYVIRSDARRFENWERYFAGQAALGVAIDYALEWGVDAIQARIYHLASILRSELSKIKSITIEDEGRERCGLVTWQSSTHSGEYIKSALAAQKINVSLSSGSGTLVSFEGRGIKELVRSSVHYFNTEEEIGRFIDVLKPIVGH